VKVLTLVLLAAVVVLLPRMTTRPLATTIAL